MPEKTFQEVLFDLKPRYDISDNNYGDEGEHISDQEIVICLKALDYYCSRFDKKSLKKVKKVKTFDELFAIVHKIVDNTYFEIDPDGYVKIIDQKIAKINQHIYGVYIVDFYTLKEKISSDVFAYVAKHLYEFFQEKLSNGLDMIIEWIENELEEYYHKDLNDKLVKNFYHLFDILHEFSFYNFPELKEISTYSKEERTLIKTVSYIYENYSMNFQPLLKSILIDDEDDNGEDQYMENFYDCYMIFPATVCGQCKIEDSILEFVNNAYGNGDITQELSNMAIYGEHEICVENITIRYRLRRLINSIWDFNGVVDKLNGKNENRKN